MGTIDFSRKLLGRLKTIVKVYGIYQARASAVATDIDVDEWETEGFGLAQLDETWISSIEDARQDYSASAYNYLINDHVGFAACHGDDIAAMGWIARGDQARGKVLNYYPLASGSYWLHADWTSPQYRGRGLHRLLIVQRAKYAINHSEHRDPTLEANIESSNKASIRNYTKLGFEKCGHILVLRLPKFRTFAWRTR